MFGITWVHPGLIHLVWVAVAFVGLLAWLELRGRDVLGRFVSALMQRRLADRPSTGRIVGRLALVLASLVAGILALMRPQTRGVAETIASSRVSADIMVVLDVSKSMLAEDAAPNRLERAKAEIDEMLDRLQGHRVGLVAFAGRAVQLAPLTPDYAFFRVVLRGVDVNSVSRGGTRIGEAIRKAIAGFPPGKGAKLILLITDGEDHESFPEEAAKQALEAGIRVVSIGFGSEDGSQIVVTDPKSGARAPVLDKNHVPVVTRLDGELLRKIALTTDGAYVPAGTSALDLDSIIAEHVQPIVREQADATVRVVPGERYPWFVLASLVTLFLAAWVGADPTRRQRR